MLLVLHERIRGVDETADPRNISPDSLVSAVNMSMDGGVLRSRPKFKVYDTGLTGRIEGASVLRPGKLLGRSMGVPPKRQGLYICVDGQIYRTDLGGNHPVEGAKMTPEYWVSMFEAEGYLIAQAIGSNTLWWRGECGPAEMSPGLHEDCEQGYDTFCRDKHKNWLLNSAGLGAYIHGRIHQDAANGVYVSDMAYKRGDAYDVLLMEEQMASSHSSPLSSSEYRGDMKAMVPFPKPGTAHGDGDLIGYYGDSIVAFDTFQFPRETRFSPEGEKLQEGWDHKRMVQVLHEGAGAVGPRAVHRAFADHIFRSKFGLHSLSQTLGIGTFKDASLNHFSFQMRKTMAESCSDLSGAAVGHWIDGQRYVATVDHHRNGNDILSNAKSMAVFNKAARFSSDGTPFASWEGTWTFDGMNIHGFHTVDSRWGILASGPDRKIVWLEPSQECDSDTEWCYVLKEYQASSTKGYTLDGGFIHGIIPPGTQVFIRSDKQQAWALWQIVDKEGPLRTPPESTRQGRWIQIKVAGKGRSEIRSLGIDVASGDKFL